MRCVAASCRTNKPAHPCAQGTLRGFDQNVNCILEDSRERMFATDAAMVEVVLGLYIIRGDNIAVVGELDEAVDAQTDWDVIRADPLKPVIH